MEKKTEQLKDGVSGYLRKCGFTEDEIEKYCRDFARIGKPLDLYSISTFYYFLKQANDLLQDKILRDALKFIAIFSLIEKLYSTHDFVEFTDWIQSKKVIQRYKSKYTELPLQELFGSLVEEYHQYHGSTRKILRFFKEIEKEEKIAVIKSIRKGISKRYKIPLLPICNESGCGLDELQQSCNFDRDREKCPMWISERKLNNYLDRIVRDIYEIRSNFVHNAEIPLFPSKGVPLFHTLNGKKSVQITFEIDYFESLLDKYFKRLLDRYVEFLDR